MKRADIISLLLVFAAVAIIYYPVLYAAYLYTDEAPQLWFFSAGTDIAWIQQGRYISYLIFQSVFNSIHTIDAVTHARIFSLAGWLICLPAWYYMLKKLAEKNGLSSTMVLLSMLYLVCMPPFAVYIGWAVCIEHFIACTAGLLSGYFLYTGIQYKGRRQSVSITPLLLSVLWGLLSLFTYQNGFGCFFIPFFIQFITGKKYTKKIFTGIAFALLVYSGYYLLFRCSLSINGMQVSGRTALSVNPLHKLLFFFGRPLASAFHFTWLFAEGTSTGIFFYLVILAGWIIIQFKQRGRGTFIQTLLYVAGVFIFLLLIYLPSLLVQENYASNRTLFALDLAVFILVAETIFLFVKDRSRHFTAVGIAIIFLASAWYNFHQQFLDPLTLEYGLIKNAVATGLTEKTDTVYFIRPPENAFEKKYGITASMDEFGVPSSAKKWVPEPLIKQLIAEQTGSRQVAEKIIVKSWAGTAAFVQSGEKISKTILFIDVQQLLEKH